MALSAELRHVSISKSGQEPLISPISKAEGRVVICSSDCSEALEKGIKKVGSVVASILYSTPFTLVVILGCAIGLVFAKSDLEYYAWISTIAFATQALCSIRIQKREHRLQELSHRSISCCGTTLLQPARETYPPNPLLYCTERVIDESAGIIETLEKYFGHPISRIPTMVSPVYPKLKFTMAAATVSMVAFLKLEELVTTLQSEVNFLLKSLTWKVYLKHACLLSSGLAATYYFSPFLEDTTLGSIFRELGMAFAARPIGFYIVRWLDYAILKQKLSKKTCASKTLRGLQFLIGSPSIPISFGFALKSTFLDLGITHPLVGMFLIGMADGAEEWNNYCKGDEIGDFSERIAKSYFELAILCLNRKHVFTALMVLFAIQDWIWPDRSNPDGQPHEGAITITAGLPMYFLRKFALLMFIKKSADLREGNTSAGVKRMVHVAKTILSVTDKALQFMIWSSLYLYEYRKYDKIVVETILCLIGFSVAISQFNAFHYRPNTASPGIDVFPGR